jgi:hemerythrin superfamily protein
MDGRRRREESAMNAMKLLEEDHRKVKKLLDEGEKTTEQATKRRTELLNELLADLRIHETIEEEIFYPALEEHAKTKEIALEGYEEHHAVDRIAEELVALDPSDETWGAKFTVMKENIEHHIEEEEGEMFQKARQVLDEDELSEIADLMESRRTELRAEAGAA